MLGLVLDPVAHTYYLADLLIDDMPLAMEAVALARHTGTALLSRRNLTSSAHGFPYPSVTGRTPSIGACEIGRLSAFARALSIANALQLPDGSC